MVWPKWSLTSWSADTKIDHQSARKMRPKRRSLFFAGAGPTEVVRVDTWPSFSSSEREDADAGGGSEDIAGLVDYVRGYYASANGERERQA